MEDQLTYYKSLPRKRIAVGVIIPRGEAILIVKPRYTPHWLLPGGVVEGGESPLQAAKRECQEELGIEVQIESLLAVDFTGQNDQGTGDAIHFIFKAAPLETSQDVRLAEEELESWRFEDTESALTLLCSKSAARLKSIRGHQTPVYLEGGQTQSLRS
ncbi:MAG: NUDIX domain-containing protein [Oligoflexales bacterium]